MPNQTTIVVRLGFVYFVSDKQNQINQEKKTYYLVFIHYMNYFRAVARSENPGGHIVLGGDNVPPLVEIGLTDLSKSGGGTCPPGPPACDRPA